MRELVFRTERRVGFTRATVFALPPATTMDSAGCAAPNYIGRATRVACGITLAVPLLTSTGIQVRRRRGGRSVAAPRGNILKHWPSNWYGMSCSLASRCGKGHARLANTQRHLTSSKAWRRNFPRMSFAIRWPPRVED